MITFVRSWQITYDKLEEAVARLSKFAEYANKNVEGYKCSLITNATGDRNQIHWVVTNESYAEFEAMTAKLLSDEGIKAIAVENPEEGLFTSTEGTFYDVVVG